MEIKQDVLRIFKVGLAAKAEGAKVIADPKNLGMVG